MHDLRFRTRRMLLRPLLASVVLAAVLPFASLADLRAPAPDSSSAGEAARFLLASGLGAQQAGAESEEDGPAELNSGLLSSFRWRSIGPAVASGRIADIAIDPTDRSTWYVAASSGGVWKTTNAGTTWDPIFDDYGSYSIGAIALDPGDHLTLWVGTGENNGSARWATGTGSTSRWTGGARSATWDSRPRCISA